MRLTKDIKNQILANILRDHEIATEAKSIMMDSRDLAYAITLDCMPEGIRTFAELLARIKAIGDDPSQMYGVSVYPNKATYSYNADRPYGIGRVYDATFEINAGGNVRTVSLSGDGHRFRVHRGYWEYKYMNKLSPDLGDIVPGYEEILLASVCEVDVKRNLRYSALTKGGHHSPRIIFCKSSTCALSFAPHSIFFTSIIKSSSGSADGLSNLHGGRSADSVSGINGTLLDPHALSIKTTIMAVRARNIFNNLFRDSPVFYVAGLFGLHGALNNFSLLPLGFCLRFLRRLRHYASAIGVT